MADLIQAPSSKACRLSHTFVAAREYFLWLRGYVALIRE
jgi:hypothetical protein